ncbi:unnamed protein product [Clavelina lepadiformis]|uniref:LRRCT domain-containing protein n=1 Tax=Clavelina lepadiformis TaxID=159417 RepID=A0ABP0FCP1_CLALP
MLKKEEFGFWVLVCVVMTIARIIACPDKCKCLGNDVHCARRGLHNFPSALPSVTIQLFVENNSITALPSPLINESQLHTLTLQDNRIQTLSRCQFCGTTSLNYMDLSSNDLRLIPGRAFANLRSLSLLNLAKNQINSIHDGAFSDLKSLRELFLSDNQISDVPARVFSTLFNLNTLRMERNAITHLPDGTFRYLTSLRFLDISQNGLQRITSGTTVGLTGLHQLFLQDNRIRKIDNQFKPPKKICSELNDDSVEQKWSSNAGCFSIMRQLRTLDLSNNLLGSIRYSSFKSQTQLTRIGLNGNKLRCDCFLIWALMRLNKEHKNNHLALGQMRCWEPEELRDVLLEDLISDPGDLSQFPQSLDDDYLEVEEQTTAPPSSKSIQFLNKKKQDFLKSDNDYLNDEAARSMDGGADEGDVSQLSTQKPVQERTQLATSMSPYPFLTSNRLPWKAPRSSAMPREFPGLGQTSSGPEPNGNVIENVNVAHIAVEREKSASSYSPIGISKAKIEEKYEVTNDRFMPTGNQNRTTRQPFFTQPETRWYPILINDRKIMPERSAPPQNDVISWLLVAAIFVAVFAIAICGAVALNRQLNSDGKRCGCCPLGGDTGRQSNSESIRSVSNYPLLYDNPLARRPLPRQPRQIERDQPKSRPPMRATSLLGDVEVEWTNGGTFGIGAGRKANISGISQGPGRVRSKLDLPPDIPPRIPLSSHHWADTDEAIVLSPRMLTAHSVTNAGYNRMMRPSVSTSSFSDASYGISSERHSDNWRKRSADAVQISSRKRSHQRNRRRPGSVIGIENSLDTQSFDLNAARAQTRRLEAAASAPVSRQNSEKCGPHHRASKRSNREKMMVQMLEALHEMDSIKRASRELLDRHIDGGRNSFNNHHPHKDKKDRNSSRKDQHFRHGSSSKIDHLRMLKSGESSCEESSSHRSDLKFSRNARVKKKLPKSSMDIDHSKQSVIRLECNLKSSSSSQETDIDFEFPPPPPCVTITCSDDSQPCSTSLSEASYEMDLPPPPTTNPHPANTVPSYETPITTNFSLEANAENEDEEESPEEKSYSMLALCSGGKPTPVKNNGGYRMRESDYKSDKKSPQNTEWFWKRKESSDSMFVSVDSNCESLSPSDEENFLTEDDPTSSPKVKIISNCTPQVIYRNKSMNKSHLLVPDTPKHYRNSMPIYNDLLRSNLGVNLTKIQQHILQERQARLRGSDRCLYRSYEPQDTNENETYFSSHRLSRLELSCSDTESNSSSSTSSLNNVALSKARSRTSSVGSSTTITPVSQLLMPRSGATSNCKENDHKRLLNLEPKASVSSQGTESVSSIEFSQPSPHSGRFKNHAYQELAHMYSAKRHPTSSLEASQTTSGKIHSSGVTNSNKANSVPNSRALSSDPNFKKIDQSRCYFDVIESSADDVSTDIEMLDLGSIM